MLVSHRIIHLIDTLRFIENWVCLSANPLRHTRKAYEVREQLHTLKGNLVEWKESVDNGDLELFVYLKICLKPLICLWLKHRWVFMVSKIIVFYIFFIFLYIIELDVVMCFKGVMTWESHHWNLWQNDKTYFVMSKSRDNKLWSWENNLLHRDYEIIKSW